jgi:hypothetical protein
MKKYLILGVLCNLYILTNAQQPYPVAPPATGNITALEYFINNRQDFGSATAVAGLSPSTNIVNFNAAIDLTGIGSGFHRIYIRSRDAAGQWSFSQNSFFDNYSVPIYSTAPPPVNITAIEYFTDGIQSFGNGSQLTGIPASINISNLNATSDLTGVLPGFHRYYIRSKDANNTWSLLNNTNYDNYIVPVYNSNSPVVNVVQLEYFIDSDPGFGNATAIPFAPGTDISSLNANINITGLIPGVHRVFIRSKDGAARWSLTNLSVFDNSSLPPYPTSPAAAPPIANMEYYIDTDPGFGNATPLVVPGNSGDISNYSVAVPLSGNLSLGTHNLFIRSKQNPWSITTVIPFTASSALPLTWSYIKAQLVNNTTLLTWATQQEINTAKFEIEHSVDGSTFVKVGTIAAAGSGTVARNYSFTHQQPVNGFNYYRIKQVDINGHFTFSAIMTVLKKNDLKRTIIAPNPVLTMLQVVEPEPVFIKDIEVFNAAGSLLMRKHISADTQVFSIPVDQLASGNYVIKINYKTDSKSYRFVKE